MNRSRLTRCLHALLAVAVVHQLLVSLIMEAPEDGREQAGLGGTLFEFHETVGLVSFAVVLAYWLWAWLRRAETPMASLLPWFSAAGMRALGCDLQVQWQALRSRYALEYEPGGPLASAVHGLGLLAISAMTATGTLWWLTYDAAQPEGVADTVKEIHELFAPLAWTYLIGHALVALWHSWHGHRAIQAMFHCRRD